MVTLSLLGGCSNNSAVTATNTSSSSGSTLATGGASTVYVVQQPQTGTGSILQFALSVNGALTPVATLTPPTGFTVTAVATDTASQIYVGGYLGTYGATPEILVYPAGSSGTATPSRTILSLSNDFYVVNSMVVDATGQLYVGSNSPGVAIFSPTATGAATPTRLITGSATVLNNVLGVAVDTAGNLYASTITATQVPTGIIVVFASTANGNASPARTITSSSTSIFYGIAVDSASNIYANVDSNTGLSGSAIVEFAAGATGAATPIASITGAATGLTYGGGLRRDAVGNLYAVEANVVSGAVSLIAFSPSATGNASPGLAFTSAPWNDGGSELALH